MKNYLRGSFNTDNIENVGLDKLKKDLEGDTMLGKAKYRKGMLTGKRPLLLAKGEYHKAEH
jgi:hypothetical protein